MKIGAIYVSGWAGTANPHAAGLCIGPNQLLHPDGKQSDFTGNKAMVRASEPWDFGDLENACLRAMVCVHPSASAYAAEILWPAENDKETRGRVWRGEYKPPSFRQWACDREQRERVAK
jgi:hypothetical protein